MGPLLGLVLCLSLIFPLSMLVRGMVEVIPAPTLTLLMLRCAQPAWILGLAGPSCGMFCLLMARLSAWLSGWGAWQYLPRLAGACVLCADLASAWA